MKYIKNFFLAIYWFFYRLTPKGRQSWILHCGFKGIKENNIKANLSKLKIIESANKFLKPRKIITFHKRKSISKSKKTNHEVIEKVKHKHTEELDDRGLEITRKGKFKHA